MKKIVLVGTRKERDDFRKALNIQDESPCTSPLGITFFLYKINDENIEIWETTTQNTWAYKIACQGADVIINASEEKINSPRKFVEDLFPKAATQFKEEGEKEDIIPPQGTPIFYRHSQAKENETFSLMEGAKKRLLLLYRSKETTDNNPSIVFDSITNNML